MTDIDRQARISVLLTWDEAGFLWRAGAAVTSVLEISGRFVYAEQWSPRSGNADAAVRHEAVRDGSVLWCGSAVEARLLARVLTASGHLAHILEDTAPAATYDWVVVTSCPLHDAPGGFDRHKTAARALRAVS